MSRHGKPTAQQNFWRDSSLPFIEARSVINGGELCYARHSHETFSVGVITGGRSSYVNGAHAEVVEAGSIVVMNPGAVHVCNPVGSTAWSYLMFHFDPAWFGRTQADVRGETAPAFRPYSLASLHAPRLADAGLELFAILTDPDSDALRREVSIVDFVTLLDAELAPGTPDSVDGGSKTDYAASYIDAHFAETLRLDELCAAAGLSPSYLIRSFKKRYGMAPHEYQINRRIQQARVRLRQGQTIAQVALETGFADQAHFQRMFKRLTAATPGQYQGRAASQPATR